jgi:hypothetical protein
MNIYQIFQKGKEQKRLRTKHDSLQSKEKPKQTLPRLAHGTPETSGPTGQTE